MQTGIINLLTCNNADFSQLTLAALVAAKTIIK
jgi:hypothetical protein